MRKVAVILVVCLLINIAFATDEAKSFSTRLKKHHQHKQHHSNHHNKHHSNYHNFRQLPNKEVEITTSTSEHNKKDNIKTKISIPNVGECEVIMGRNPIQLKYDNTFTLSSSYYPERENVAIGFIQIVRAGRVETNGDKTVFKTKVQWQTSNMENDKLKRNVRVARTEQTNGFRIDRPSGRTAYYCCEKVGQDYNNVGTAFADTHIGGRGVIKSPVGSLVIDNTGKSEFKIKKASIHDDPSHHPGYFFEAVSFIVDVGTGQRLDGVFWGFECDGVMEGEHKSCMKPNKLKIYTPTLFSTMAAGNTQQKNFHTAATAAFDDAMDAFDQDLINTYGKHDFPVSELDQAPLRTFLGAFNNKQKTNFVPFTGLQGKFDAKLVQKKATSKKVEIDLQITVKFKKGDGFPAAEKKVKKALASSSTFWSDRYRFVTRYGVDNKIISVRVKTNAVLDETNPHYTFKVFPAANGMLTKEGNEVAWRAGTVERSMSMKDADLDFKPETDMWNHVYSKVVFRGGSAIMNFLLEYDLDHYITGTDIDTDAVDNFCEAVEKYSTAGDLNYVFFPPNYVITHKNAQAAIALSAKTAIDDACNGLVRIKLKEIANDKTFPDESACKTTPNCASISLDTDEPDKNTYPGWKKYKKSFYKTLDHEMGHAWGLVDEYMATSSADNQQQQYANGAWPASYVPNVPADGNTAWNTAQVEWGAAMDAKICIQPYITSSVMNAGFQVFPIHYSPFFHVFCEFFKSEGGVTAPTDDDLRDVCQNYWMVVPV